MMHSNLLIQTNLTLRMSAKLFIKQQTPIMNQRVNHNAMGYSLAPLQIDKPDEGYNQILFFVVLSSPGVNDGENWIRVKMLEERRIRVKRDIPE